MDRQSLDRLSREELIETADGLGVERAGVLTRVELIDEIVRRSVADPQERTLARGLLGLARDLLADVVERGLHLPDAAARIRSRSIPRWPAPRAPIATVTLAEIYAKQGLRDRALSVLDEVLRDEPEHAAARALREQILASPAAAPQMPPEPDEAVAAAAPQAVPAPSAEPVAPHTVQASTAEQEAEPAARAPAEQAGEPVARPVAEHAAEASARPADTLAIEPASNGVRLRWEMGSPPDGRDHDGPPSPAIVRVLVVVPSWQEPLRNEIDRQTSGQAGEIVLDGVPPYAVIRAALGFMQGERFVPLALAELDPRERWRSPAGPTRGNARAPIAIAFASPS